MTRIPFAAATVAAIALAVVRPAVADETSRLQEAARVVEETKSEIPQDLWDRARCVAVIPNLKKAALVFGGEYGRGVMSCRAGEGWSAPLYMQLAKGSWGFQAGAEEVDLVLLVMNESGVEKLLKNKVTLGADASVAAGPVGRRGAVGTDAALTAEIVSYSRSKGLFAGIDLSGGVLRPDEDSNKTIYGANASPRTILASREIAAPTAAAPFIRALGAATSTSAAADRTTTARSSEPEARTTTKSTTDDDVRTRLVDAQQTLDRILSESTPAPVGTTGSTSDDRRQSGTVTVDRARLLQLRQQIEAAMAALRR